MTGSFQALALSRRSVVATMLAGLAPAAGTAVVVSTRVFGMAAQLPGRRARWRIA